MNISIRKAKENDGITIKDMFYHAIFVPKDQPLPTKEIVEDPELAKYYERWGRPNDIEYIAYENYNLVGAVWIRMLTDELKNAQPAGEAALAFGLESSLVCSSGSRCAAKHNHLLDERA